MQNNNQSINRNWNSFSCIHPKIAENLIDSGKIMPSSIQQQVYSSFSYYYDFLIAAQTGSGKTLAFTAPILSQILFLKQKISTQIPKVLLGLILTPTRQLAQQIYQSIIGCNTQIGVTCIIGGISRQKQLRILRERKPQIIIGTPGRVAQLLQDQILNFQNLKYLIIDQADRMIEMGHFKETDKILQAIFMPKKQQIFDKDFHQISQKLKQQKPQTFFIRHNGKKVKLSMSIDSLPTDQLFQVPANLFQIAGQNNIILNKEQKAKKQKKQVKKKQQKMDIQISNDQKLFLSKLKRRIFFVSATLTRQFKGSKYFIKKNRTQQQWQQKRKQRKDKRKQKQKQQKYGKTDNQKTDKQKQQQMIPKLQALLSRAQFTDKPKIIDLSSSLFLPIGLQQYVSFSQGEQQRISIALCYLLELPQNSKIIIFGNTIKACKRIQFFLQSMDIQTVNLHSHMQQRQRISKLQKFKKSTLCNIMIATDVAARGIDFTVTHVLQLGVPPNGDTYVHRAGRTARAGRSGHCLVIVDKKQGNRWIDINDVLNESSTDRKVIKYLPNQIKFEQMTAKINDLQWVRRNQQKTKGVRTLQIQQQQADALGLLVEQQAPRKKYDLDREEEQQVRIQVKKKSQLIKQQVKSKAPQTQQQNWKKNKLVLSLDQIKKYL